MSSNLEELARHHAERLGISLTSNYVNSTNKMSFIVLEGKFKGLTGFIDYTGLRRSKSLSYNSLNDDSKKKYQDYIAKIKRCDIVKYADSYKVNSTMLVVDFYGRTRTTTFTELVRSKPLGISSYGEYIIAGILKVNNIEYVPQYKIETCVGVQYLDFYLPEYSIGIEYNGVQHYQETNYFSKSLVEQQRYDGYKYDYCKNNGINLKYIKHTESSSEGIQLALASFGLPVETLFQGQNTMLDVSSLLTYYAEHTRKETAKKFGLSESQVTKLAVSNGFVKRGFAPPKYSAEEVIDLYIHKDMSRNEVSKILDISVATVTKVAKSYGYRKVPSRYGTKVTKVNS